MRQREEKFKKVGKGRLYVFVRFSDTLPCKHKHAGQRNTGRLGEAVGNCREPCYTQQEPYSASSLLTTTTAFVTLLRTKEHSNSDSPHNMSTPYRASDDKLKNQQQFVEKHNKCIFASIHLKKQFDIFDICFFVFLLRDRGKDQSSLKSACYL